jgi:hypothetical protein
MVKIRFFIYMSTFLKFLNLLESLSSSLSLSLSCFFFLLLFYIALEIYSIINFIFLTLFRSKQRILTSFVTKNSLTLS